MSTELYCTNCGTEFEEDEGVLLVDIGSIKPVNTFQFYVATGDSPYLHQLCYRCAPSLQVEPQSNKWSRDYPGFESIIDFDSDMHIEDALEAICPNNEWSGTIRITFEYIPSPKERKHEEDCREKVPRLASARPTQKVHDGGTQAAEGSTQGGPGFPQAESKEKEIDACT